MADFRAIAGAGESLARLLRTAYRADLLNHELRFELYTRSSFEQPMAAGVSLFLYEVVPNGTSRIPPGRTAPDGRRRFRELPLDLHYLLTFWGANASLQHGIAGWVMRQLEDAPLLGSSLLEAAAPGVFRPDESLEITRADLTTEDLLHLWEVIAPDRGYELSAAYRVRDVRIESAASESVGAPVQERVFLVAPGVDRDGGGG